MTRRATELVILSLLNLSLQTLFYLTVNNDSSPFRYIEEVMLTDGRKEGNGIVMRNLIELGLNYSKTDLILFI